MLRLSLLLPLLIAACEKDETISGYVDQNATYHLIEITGVPFDANATISFPEEGKIRGKAPCNRYSARQSAPLPWFEISAIASTRSICPEHPQETVFFENLSNMTVIETLGNTVILRNDTGAEMVFKSDSS